MTSHWWYTVITAHTVLLHVNFFLCCLSSWAMNLSQLENEGGGPGGNWTGALTIEPRRTLELCRSLLSRDNHTLLSHVALYWAMPRSLLFHGELWLSHATISWAKPHSLFLSWHTLIEPCHNLLSHAALSFCVMAHSDWTTPQSHEPCRTLFLCHGTLWLNHATISWAMPHSLFVSRHTLIEPCHNLVSHAALSFCFMAFYDWAMSLSTEPCHTLNLCPGANLIEPCHHLLSHATLYEATTAH